MITKDSVILRGALFNLNIGCIWIEYNEQPIADFFPFNLNIGCIWILPPMKRQLFSARASLTLTLVVFE